MHTAGVLLIILFLTLAVNLVMRGGPRTIKIVAPPIYICTMSADGRAFECPTPSPTEEPADAETT